MPKALNLSHPNLYNFGLCCSVPWKLISLIYSQIDAANIMFLAHHWLCQSTLWTPPLAPHIKHKLLVFTFRALHILFPHYLSFLSHGCGVDSHVQLVHHASLYHYISQKPHVVPHVYPRISIKICEGFSLSCFKSFLKMLLSCDTYRKPDKIPYISSVFPC